MTTPRFSDSELRRLIFLIGSVQFVNILDFMIVMPLGPDFAQNLGVPVSQVGIVGGAYTAAAALSGLAGAFFLDRFDRRTALTLAMIGLVCGTLLCGIAQGLGSLVLARCLAGAFGGPATSISNSIIADAVPPSQRGRAMGALMGAFAVASVFGVPVGLELAQLGNWRLPFIAVGAMGLCLSLLAFLWLPSMKQHIAASQSQSVMLTLKELLRRQNVWLSYAMTFVVMMAGFSIIPNISAFVQGNLGYPRGDMGRLYLVGGCVSFFTMRFVGRMVDVRGSFATGSVGTVLLMLVLYIGFIRPFSAMPVMAIFVAFMFAMSFRNVSYNTLTSKVPKRHERARFMSIQSAVQHMASALGAFMSSLLLSQNENHALVGMANVAWISFGLTAILPLLLYRVERSIAS